MTGCGQLPNMGVRQSNSSLLVHSKLPTSTSLPGMKVIFFLCPFSYFSRYQNPDREKSVGPLKDPNNTVWLDGLWTTGGMVITEA